jgi:hypothetical protein
MVENKILNEYLTQQANETTSLVPHEDITLEDFKNLVKKWIESDAYIKKASEIIREKKKQRDKLSEVITKFMCKYNIEDLNTKEGKIRCKTSYTKYALSQKDIKEKVTNLIPEKRDMIIKIFDDRPKKEKISLRRLKIS